MSKRRADHISINTRPNALGNTGQGVPSDDESEYRLPKARKLMHSAEGNSEARPIDVDALDDTDVDSDGEPDSPTATQSVTSGALSRTSTSTYVRALSTSSVPQPGPSRSFGRTNTVAVMNNIEETSVPRLPQDPSSAPGNSSYKVTQGDTGALAWFCKLRLPFGVQFLLAAGVSNGLWTWDEISGILRKPLASDLTNVDAMKAIARDLSKFESLAHAGRNHPFVKAFADVKLWDEYDVEELALEENEGRGLGLRGEWHGHPNWFGGQIEQIGRLVQVDDTFRIDLRLPVRSQKSRVLTRLVGSRRVLQVSIPDGMLKQYEPALLRKTQKFLAQPLCILGRIFMLFHIKENRTAWYIETVHRDDESYTKHKSDQKRYSFEQVVKGINPGSDKRDCKQLLMKFITRNVLSLSITTPVLEFATSNMWFVADLEAQGSNDPDLSGTDCCLTDGAGLMNEAAVKAISQVMGYERPPTAFQGRIAGSKGVWSQAVPGHEAFIDVASKLPCITIFDSQQKIHHPKHDVDPLFMRSNHIFCLVKPSKPNSSVSLNKQIIPCLWYAGVYPEIFQHILKAGLDKATAPFLLPFDSAMDTTTSLCLLYSAVEKAGSITSARSRDFLAGQARAQGYGQQFHGDEDLEADGALTFSSDPSSGYPTNLYVKALQLISSGFHPKDCQLLLDSLHQIISNVIDRFSDDYHLPIDDAYEAFAVPDFTGTLLPGQIYYNPTGYPGDLILGSCLVYRNPLGLPSDCRKAEAVDCQLLHHLYGIIIISAHKDCHRSLMSECSGGDYDGDTMIIIHNKDVVNHFERQSPVIPMKDDFIKKTFIQSDVRAQTLIEHVATFGAAFEREQAWSTSFSEGLAFTLFGAYSTFHDKAYYQDGYDSQEARELHWIFNTEMDGKKSGKALRPDVHKAYTQKWQDIKMPDCLVSMEDKEKKEKKRQGNILISNQYAKKTISRSELLSRKEADAFVLDSLKTAAAEEKTRIVALLPKSSTCAVDKDLTCTLDATQALHKDPTRLGRTNELKNREEAWMELDKLQVTWRGLSRARSEVPIFDLPLVRRSVNDRPDLPTRPLEEELAIIESHVDRCVRLFADATRTNNAPSRVTSPVKASARTARKEKQPSEAALFAEVARAFAELEPSTIPYLAALGVIDKFKASFAIKKGSAAFAFRVAFDQLCAMKAESPAGRVRARAIREKTTIQASIVRFMKLAWEETLLVEETE